MLASSDAALNAKKPSDKSAMIIEQASYPVRPSRLYASPECVEGPHLSFFLLWRELRRTEAVGSPLRCLEIVTIGADRGSREGNNEAHRECGTSYQRVASNYHCQAQRQSQQTSLRRHAFYPRINDHVTHCEVTGSRHGAVALAGL